MITRLRPRQLPPLRHFVGRMLYNFAFATVVIAGSLGMGALGYRHFENQSWIDAFLNAAMILTGMGPLDRPLTEGGKYFAMAYALFSGVIFLGTVAVMLTPVAHRFLHRFHLEMLDE